MRELMKSKKRSSGKAKPGNAEFGAPQAFLLQENGNDHG